MSAVISECGTYRYYLTRERELNFPEKGTALFIMLNPSKADATVDDPTIRRCRSFAKSWSCSGITVANLYALRLTDPKKLRDHHDPIGPENDTYLYSLAKEYGDVVCAWGANAAPERAAKVSEIFRAAGARMWCLGVTKNGSPRHPLYVASSQALMAWEHQNPHASSRERKEG